MYNHAQRIAKATAQSVEQVSAKHLEEAFIELPHAHRNPTRNELIENLKNLRASGAFDHVESLYGKYANPNVPEMCEEEFHANLLSNATDNP